MTSRDSLPRLDHVTEGLGCWCKPNVFALCPTCKGDGCDACEGGLRRVAPELAPATPEPLVVVHHGAPLIVQ